MSKLDSFKEILHVIKEFQTIILGMVAILAIFGAGLIVGYEKIFRVLDTVPIVVWILFAIIISLGIFIFFNRWRIQNHQRWGSDIGLKSVVSFEGYVKYGELTNSDVIWFVNLGIPEWFEHYVPMTSRIDVLFPPRCPRCKTELKEYNDFLGYYIWECANCGFKRKGVDSFYKIYGNVLKIARRDIEMMAEKKKESSPTQNQYTLIPR